MHCVNTCFTFYYEGFSTKDEASCEFLFWVIMSTAFSLSSDKWSLQEEKTYTSVCVCVCTLLTMAYS